MDVLEGLKKRLTEKPRLTHRDVVLTISTRIMELEDIANGGPSCLSYSARKEFLRMRFVEETLILNKGLYRYLTGREFNG